MAGKGPTVDDLGDLDRVDYLDYLDCDLSKVGFFFLSKRGLNILLQ